MKELINDVGPVLIANELSQKIIAAIKTLNHPVMIQNKGSYLRVLVPQQCVLTRAAIEEQIGCKFILPEDLEPLMPSFKGILTMSREKALWTLKK